MILQYFILDKASSFCATKVGSHNSEECGISRHIRYMGLAFHRSFIHCSLQPVIGQVMKHQENIF